MLGCNTSRARLHAEHMVRDLGTDEPLTSINRLLRFPGYRVKSNLVSERTMRISAKEAHVPLPAANITTTPEYQPPTLNCGTLGSGRQAKLDLMISLISCLPACPFRVGHQNSTPCGRGHLGRVTSTTSQPCHRVRRARLIDQTPCVRKKETACYGPHCVTTHTGKLPDHPPIALVPDFRAVR